MKIKQLTTLKHKLQWLLLLAALLGVSQGVWGNNEYNRKYLYIDARNQTWYYNDGCTVYMNVFSDKSCTRWISNAENLSRLTGNYINVSYCDVDTYGGKSNARGFKTARCSGWYNQYSRGVEDGQTHNCLRITDNQGSNEWTTFVLEPTSVSLEITGSFAGSGTSADPYLVHSGNNFTLTATPTYDISDPDMASRYKIDTSENNTPSETSNSVTITANWEEGTTRHYYASARGYYTPGNTYTSPATHVTDDVYVQVAADYYVTGNGNANGWCDNKSWNAAGSPMTSLGDNVYAKTFTNVTVADNLQFRVTDGTLTNTYGWSNIDDESCTPAAMQSKVTSAGSDNNINLNTSGTSYTIITIKFNSSTKKVWVEFAEVPKFREGQIIWLDVRSTWYNSDVMYVDFRAETKNESYDGTYHKIMTKVAGSNNNLFYVYKVTSSDESLNKETLRFRRGDANNLWNHSVLLSASEVANGTINGVYVTGYDDTGGTCLFTPSNTVVSNPSLEMKNSAGSSTITECQAGDEVKFSSTVPTISVNNTSKGSLTTPLYIYSFTEGSYSSSQTTSNPYSWTTAVANSGAGTASVKVSFAIDGSNTSSRTIDSGYEKTGSTSFTVNTPCANPRITSDLSSSDTWTKCGNANGRELSITADQGTNTLTYQWFRNSSNPTGEGGVADLTGATAVTDMVEGGNTYSPSASDYGVFYYCCVVRSGGACSANKAVSHYTGAIEIKQTPTVKPSTIAVKQFEPVRITASNSSVTWAITTPAAANVDQYYLYDATKSSAMFKGDNHDATDAGTTYVITATPTGSSDCTATSNITVQYDDTECQP